MVYYFTPFQIVYGVWDHDAIWEMLAEKNVYLRYVQVNVLNSAKRMTRNAGGAPPATRLVGTV